MTLPGHHSRAYHAGTELLQKGAEFSFFLLGLVSQMTHLQNQVQASVCEAASAGL